MSEFLIMKKNRNTSFLEMHPCANHLLNILAIRANTHDEVRFGLLKGQYFIPNARHIGLTQKQYSLAKKQLEEWGYASFKGTNKGTLATLLNSDVYDINPSINNYK